MKKVTAVMSKHAGGSDGRARVRLECGHYAIVDKGVGQRNSDKASLARCYACGSEPALT